MIKHFSLNFSLARALMQLTMGPSNSAKETTTKGGRRVYGILAGKIFDSRARKLVENQVVIVDGELGVILDVINLNEFQQAQRHEDMDLIDLGQWTLVPGLVDVHVHCKMSSHSYLT